MTRREAAEGYFEAGYNCSQAVVLAFADMTDVDKESMLKLASSFGGGMGRLREVCGAVSGMFMICGLLYGCDEAKSPDKAEHYKRIQELAKRFETETGSIICRTILGLPDGKDDYKPSERTPQYYKKRPCKTMVGIAAEILEEFIQEQKK